MKKSLYILIAQSGEIQTNGKSRKAFGVEVNSVTAITQCSKTHSHMLRFLASLCLRFSWEQENINTRNAIRLLSHSRFLRIYVVIGRNCNLNIFLPLSGQVTLNNLEFLLLFLPHILNLIYQLTCWIIQNTPKWVAFHILHCYSLVPIMIFSLECCNSPPDPNTPSCPSQQCLNLFCFFQRSQAVLINSSHNDWESSIISH